jgi:hypothetical protein
MICPEIWEDWGAAALLGSAKVIAPNEIRTAAKLAMTIFFMWSSCFNLHSLDSACRIIGDAGEPVSTLTVGHR